MKRCVGPNVKGYRVIQRLPEDYIMCMSNVVGRKIQMPFSFFFSTKDGMNHAIRVKPVFNPDRMLVDESGVLELHGEWRYTPGKNDKHVKQKDVDEMKAYFRKYKVLFVLVWEKLANGDDVSDYLKGYISLEDFIRFTYFWSEYPEELSKIHSIEDLESWVKESKVCRWPE